MRFIDKRLFLKKLAATNSLRNHILNSQPTPIPELFFESLMFISSFYDRIIEDENTKEILHELALANDTQLDAVNKLLTFWWFWSLDRLGGKDALGHEAVRQGLKEIWGFSEIDLEQTIKYFDKKQPNITNELWKMICEVLCNTSLSPIFAFVHLRNAQIETLRTVDNLE